MKHVALDLGALADERALTLATEGVLLGRYRFDRYLGEEARKPDLVESATLLARDKALGRLR